MSALFITMRPRERSAWNMFKYNYRSVLNLSARILQSRSSLLLHLASLFIYGYQLLIVVSILCSFLEYQALERQLAELAQLLVGLASSWMSRARLPPMRCAQHVPVETSRQARVCYLHCSMFSFFSSAHLVCIFLIDWCELVSCFRHKRTCL